MKYIFRKNGIGIEEYLQAGFEEIESFNEYKSSDYRGIKINDNMIHISNIQLDKKYWVNEQIETNTIFNGMYSYVMINKKINKIYIEKNTQNIQFGRGQVVLDNQYFEKYFNIFSENRMLTMRILTPQVMEKMLEFIKNNYINFKIIINGNKIHFKFFTEMISPPGYFRLNNKKIIESSRRYIYYYYTVFKFIIEMTDYLSNTINELDI